MKTRGLLRGVLFIFLTATAAQGDANAQAEQRSASSSSAERPNIVFILTDDQAPYAVGSVGHRQFHTPNMDRLVDEGARLKNAFVTTPVCSPSRATFLTGHYASEWDITDWINPRKEAELGLDPEAVTWPELLQQAGYRTGLVGKWHLGTQDRYHPTRQGFDYFMGFREGGTRTENPTLEIGGKNKKFQGLTVDILTEHAIEFIERNRQKPFLLALHHRAPHTRYLPVADADWAPYENLTPELADFPENLFGGLRVDYCQRRFREYMAAVTGVDRNLGRVLRTLDRLDLTRQTLLVFTSDHGYNNSHHGLWYKGNAHWVVQNPPPATEHVPQKRRPNMFDTSIRVPCFVRWPGVIEAGTTVTETVSNLDWFPTLLAAAGVEIPQEVTVRGRNILPLLKGQSVEDWNHVLYGEYSMHHGARTQMRMIRTPGWKLVRDFQDRSRDEFYNLQKDPQERNNLIDSENPQIQQTINKLHRNLLDHMRKIDDPALNQRESSSR